MIENAECGRNKAGIHELKILPEYFEAVKDGRKTWEIRKDDRGYKDGDILFLREYEKGRYTGRYCFKNVTYIYRGDGTFGLSDDYVIMSID